MSYEFIIVDIAAHVTTVTLNRPAALNSITPEMHTELQSAFDTFAGDDEQYICVITGMGKAFCAGSDLKAALRNGLDTTYPKNGYAGLIDRHDLFKPIIAAVNGVCLGGGFEIALACDLIIATNTASFGLPEPRIGAIALGGGVHRLVRQIGLKRAMDCILTCRRISAEQGMVLGFVNEVVDASALTETVARWCGEILSSAPLAIRASKEVAMRGLDEPTLADALHRQAEYPGFKSWRWSDDTKEGTLAFVEKRAPVWKAR